MNSIIVERDIYRQANDTLNSIILNQDARFLEAQQAINSLKTQNRYLQEMNAEYTTLNSKCDDEVKSQKRKVKFWRTATYVAGSIAIGLIAVIALK